ncbi:MAG: hypothetical protein R2844_03890 [Caldilineales bacterium]
MMIWLPEEEFAQRTAVFQERLREASREGNAELAELRRDWEREPDSTTRFSWPLPSATLQRHPR